MPRANRICLFTDPETQKRCVQRVTGDARIGRCDTHKHKNPVPWQRSPGSEYNSTLGKRTKQAILSKHPFCYDPFSSGCTLPSKDVDHVVPKWKGGKDSLDNLRGVCYSCHKRKSSLEGVEARALRRSRDDR